ncbi:MAG: hypothetical protein ACI9K5_002924 [Gammaproteobacteria bacterium]|jgi:hypothetical protein
MQPLMRMPKSPLDAHGTEKAHGNQEAVSEDPIGT